MSFNTILLRFFLITTVLSGASARVLESSMIDMLARTVGFIHFANPTDSNPAHHAYIHIRRTANAGDITVWNLAAEGLERTQVAHFNFNLFTGEMLFRQDHVVLPARTSYEMGPVLVLYEFENEFQIIYYTNGQENVLLTSHGNRPVIRSLNNQWFSVLIPELNRQSQTIFFNRETLTQTRLFSNVLLANHDASVVLFSDELNVLKLAVSLNRQQDWAGDSAEQTPVMPHPVGKLGNPLVMDDEYSIFELDTEEFAQDRPFVDVIKGITLQGGHTLVLVFLGYKETYLTRAFYSLRTGERLYFN